MHFTLIRWPLCFLCKVIQSLPALYHGISHLLLDFYCLRIYPEITMYGPLTLRRITVCESCPIKKFKRKFFFHLNNPAFYFQESFLVSWLGRRLITTLEFSFTYQRGKEKFNAGFVFFFLRNAFTKRIQNICNI